MAPCSHAPKQAHPGPMKAQKSFQYGLLHCSLGLSSSWSPIISDEAEGCPQVTTLPQSADPTASACAWDRSRWLLALKGFVVRPLCISPSVVPSHRCIFSSVSRPSHGKLEGLSKPFK